MRFRRYWRRFKTEKLRRPFWRGSLRRSCHSLSDDFLPGENLRSHRNTFDDCGRRGVFYLCLLGELAVNEAQSIELVRDDNSDPSVAGGFLWALVHAAEVNAIEH